MRRTLGCLTVYLVTATVGSDTASTEPKDPQRDFSAHRPGAQRDRFLLRAADFLVRVGWLPRRRSPSTNTSSSRSTVDCQPA